MELVAGVASPDDGGVSPIQHKEASMSTRAAKIDEKPNPVSRPRRVPVGSPAYNRLTEFLYEEALLLDELRLDDWVGVLAEDLIYTAPLRMTRSLADQQLSIVRTMNHFDETFASIKGRVIRLTKTKSAWAEDPPSRTRRLVTNVLVDATDIPSEFKVTSYVLLTRSRFEETELGVLTMVRHDLLRETDHGVKLARREIIIDQSVLGMCNLAVFL